MDKPPIYLVTALQSEATPLIEHFRLKASASRPFREYRSDHVHLMVTGMGKINAAAATAALLHADADGRRGVGVNVGIAGHASLALGEVFVAHRIADAASSKDWYPQMTFNPRCPSSELYTVDAPTEHYPDNAGVDMEASAYYVVATRYLSNELTQTVKVVSDTPEHPIAKLNKHVITDLVRAALPQITHVIERLVALASAQFDATGLAALSQRYQERWRLSVNQQLQLSRLLERHHALSGSAPEPDTYAHLRQPKAMLHALQADIAEQGLRFT